MFLEVVRCCISTATFWNEVLCPESSPFDLFIKCVSMKECCDRHHGIRCENIYFAKQTHVMMYDVCTLHDEDMRTSKRSVGREGETGKKVVNNKVAWWLAFHFGNSARGKEIILEHRFMDAWLVGWPVGMGLLCPSSSPWRTKRHSKWYLLKCNLLLSDSSFHFMCILSCMCYSFTYHIHIMSVIIILVQLLKLLLSFAHIETTQRRSNNSMCILM